MKTTIMDINWEDVRKNFPVTEKSVFFETNHATLSLIGADAINNYVNKQLYGTLDEIKDQILTDTRQSAAKLLNCKPDEIGLIRTTSEGLNIIANGLELEIGDRVILNEYEHSNAIYAWKNVQKKGINIDWVETDDGMVTVEALKRVVTDRTKVLMISAVTYSPGNQNDLAALGQFCREHGIIVVVDAMQALGAVPIDVKAMNIDYLVSGGQKYLYSQTGIAVLYCSEKIIDRVIPPFVGMTSLDTSDSVEKKTNLYEITFKKNAQKFELGFNNLIGAMVLKANIDYLLNIGIENIRDHLWEVNYYMVQGLLQRGLNVTSQRSGNLCSSIVTFEYAKGTELLKYLRQNNVRMSYRKGLLRACLGLFNNFSDVDKMLSLIDKFEL